MVTISNPNAITPKWTPPRYTVPLSRLRPDGKLHGLALGRFPKYDGVAIVPLNTPPRALRLRALAHSVRVLSPQGQVPREARLGCPRHQAGPEHDLVVHQCSLIPTEAVKRVQVLALEHVLLHDDRRAEVLRALRKGRDVVPRRSRG